MKKFYVILTALLLVVALSACKKDSTTTAGTTASTTATTATTETTATTGTTEDQGNFNVADGMYFAAGEFSGGYRYYVIVTVADKHITDLEWNGYHIDGGAAKCKGEDKFTCAQDGKYGMNNPDAGTTTDKGKGTWDDQATAATQWILDNQTLDVTFNTGKTDAIASVSVTTEELFTLVEEALAAPAVPHGTYANDGYYYVESTKLLAQTYEYAAEAPDGTALANKTGTYDSYTFGTFVIVNGTLVIADFNATYALFDFKVDGSGAFVKTNNLKVVLCDAAGKPNKTYLTKDAAQLMYGMRAAGGEWYVQADLVEAKLLADQSLNITVTSGSGVIDGLASVSMGHSVASFKEILDKLATEVNA